MRVLSSTHHQGKISDNLPTIEKIMYSGKFIDLPEEDKKDYIKAAFVFKEDQGWFSSKGEYAGADIEEVIKVLIDLEDAEINSIGDCMSGMCVTPPQLSDFVKKK